MKQTYRKISLGILSIILMSMLSIWMAVPGAAQSKKELQKQRDELNAQIELTKKLIRDAEKMQKSTTAQVQLLNEQMSLREKLLQNINGDIKHLDGEIAQKSNDIKKLKEQVEVMKKEYAKMVYNAYRNRSSYDKMMYIFAADDFHQGYKRFKMTQRYAEARKKQAEVITSTQREIEQTVIGLETSRKDKERLAQKKELEKREIEQNKREQQTKLAELKGEESKLREQQKKQQVDRDKLTAKIQQIIAEEIRKEEERKRAEAAKKAGSKAPDKDATAGGKTTSVELAPETQLINADFEKNKGLLPWPVSSGVITSRFGRHPHASIAQVEVNNNGIDFSTEVGAYALAVFGGKVTSVFTIPGAGQNVIVTHGSYKTVYSGLSEVTVKVGDTVDVRQRLGRVQSDGDQNTLHFEVWKVESSGGKAQNPELWIKKR
jgi:septal ring factor EnvC (AmiA/AmiB activator)